MVKLAYSVDEDANVLISLAGKEYATKLAIGVLRAAGHEVDTHVG